MVTRPALEDLDGLSDLAAIDPADVDWTSTTRLTYLVHQRARYEYSGPVEELCQRLVLCPRRSHGSQRLLRHRLDVDCDGDVALRRWRDEFGNSRVEVRIPRIERSVTFTAWSVIHRAVGRGQRLPSITGFTQRLLRPTPLTRPDAALRAAARRLRASGLHGAALAHAACDYVHSVMTYGHDVTSVRTTASEAFALRGGVCQDYAHVLITLCRLLGLPARYVSGHLLGEGGSHAWVEVAVPGDTRMRVLALDPTHNRETGPTYVTVAVGRDYQDVAPFSGSYRAAHVNELSAKKRMVLLDAA